MKNEGFAAARAFFTSLPLKGVGGSLFFLLSCISGTVFHSYKPLPAEGWERGDTVCFDLPQAAVDFNGTLTIGLRTVAHVGMQDIVLAVEQCDEDSVN